jgi:hypothetical protein
VILKSIWSSTKLIEEFLRHCRPATQNLQDTFQELKDALYREGFPVDDKTISEECKTEEEYHPPTAEEVLEEQIHEESFQEEEDPKEVQHPDEQDETLVSFLPLDEDEVVLPYLFPAHEDEEMISLDDADDLVENLSDVVDQHIDDFIHVGRRRWDASCFIFYRDPIYDIESSSRAKGFELSSSEDSFSCVYDSDVWQPDDDMVTDLFCPFEDDLSQHTQGDLQSSFGSCDAYPLGDADLFYENSQSPSPSDLDGHQYVAIPEQLKIHTTEQQYFHLGDFCKDLQVMKQHILGIQKDSFSRPELVPYLISPSQGNHGVFLGSLIFSQSSGSSDYENEDEDESSPTCDSLVLRWIDRACGRSFQRISSLPPISMSCFL